MTVIKQEMYLTKYDFYFNLCISGFQFYKKPPKYEITESIDLNWSNDLGQQTEKVRCFLNLILSILNKIDSKALKSKTS